MKLALALERARVHDLDGDGERLERAGEDGAEPSLAEAVGEGVGGAAEDGVGEAVRRLCRVGIRRGGAFPAGEFAVEDDEE